VSISKRPLVLNILDGWGHRADTASRVIALARKPTCDEFLSEYLNTRIRASDHFVGRSQAIKGRHISPGRCASVLVDHKPCIHEREY